MVDRKRAELTERQQRFVDEYLIDLNATQAAIRAGYARGSNDQGAATEGSRLLRNAQVQALVRKGMAERAAAVGVSKERVLIELARIAFADIRDVVDVNQHAIRPKAFDTLPRDITAAVAEVSERVSRDATTVKIKMLDKQKALELLGRHLGMWNDKLEVDVSLDPLEERREAFGDAWGRWVKHAQAQQLPEPSGEGESE